MDKLDELSSLVARSNAVIYDSSCPITLDDRIPVLLDVKLHDERNIIQD
jgi:hypothetical protein